MVFRGLMMAWRLASWPTTRSPVSVNPITDGVRLEPCLLAITFGSPPSMTETTLLVVPRSIPTILAILASSELSDFVLPLIRNPRANRLAERPHNYLCHKWLLVLDARGRSSANVTAPMTDPYGIDR